MPQNPAQWGQRQNPHHVSELSPAFPPRDPRRYLEAARKKADQILREAEEQAGRLPEESEESEEPEEPEAPKAPEQPEYRDEDPARVDKIWSMLEDL